MMLFDLFDVTVIVASIFYYIVMGFGFVSDVNKVQGYKFSFVDIISIAFWPAFMFFRALISFSEGE